MRARKLCQRKTILLGLVFGQGENKPGHCVHAADWVEGGVASFVNVIRL